MNKQKFIMGGKNKLIPSNNKKKLTMIALSLLMLVVLIGGTYAVWNYASISDANTITTGQITMSYSEKNEILLLDALPMSDENGKKLDEYFDFSVSTYVKTREDDNLIKKINYNILLEKLQPVENTTSLEDSEVKIYLTQVNSDGTETEVVAPTTIDKLGEYLIKSQKEEFKNNKSRVETNYRLRAWIDFNVEASTKFNGDASYSYNFRVNINNNNNWNEVVVTDNTVSLAAESEVDYQEVVTEYTDNVYLHSYDPPTGTNEFYFYCCQDTMPEIVDNKYKVVGTYRYGAQSRVGKYCSGTSYAIYGSGSAVYQDRPCDISKSHVTYYKSGGNSFTSGEFWKVRYNVEEYYYKANYTYTPVNYILSSTYAILNSTGKFVLTSPVKETYSSSHVNYYICEDQVSTICSVMYKITAVNDSTHTITKVDKYTLTDE